MTKHYFPDADDPVIQPFTQAFVRMMFSHAAFERRIADLLETITGDAGFGERPEVGRWSADSRPRNVGKLVSDHYPSGLPEKAAIVDCLKRAKPLFRDRNRLAHGTWWEFSAGAITVRSGIDWPSEEQHRTFTAFEIQQTATSLDDLEVELWRLQKTIRERKNGGPPSSDH
jgi:hypothetical protein